MPSVLIVDDDLETRAALVEVAELAGFSASGVGTLAEATTRLSEARPDIVLTDLVLPDGTGLDLLRAIEGAGRPEVVLVTGHASVDSAIEALRQGVLDYLTKPVDVPRLKTILSNAARTIAMKNEIGRLRGQLRDLGHFGPMIGHSPAIRAVYDLIERVAPTDAAVLLTGESGTGKELAAQTLHELSPRRRGPFVPVNCSALPANLVESELFGHERGSFTGATQQHRGVFERATGGTLFLDEITEMSADLQAKLLRVLETGTVVRIGGEAPIAVDARLIAATNRVPETAVRDGVLREDLYYRLNVFPIQLPPLRERDGDSGLLADHFLALLNQAQGTDKRLSDAARQRISAYGWPGNVRELMNALRREFILADEVIEFESLGTGPVARAAPPGAGLSLKPGTPLEEVERRMILATLDQCGGDKPRAAEMLGISLKTIYNRLSRYAGHPPGESGS